MVMPTEALARSPSHKRPSVSELQELAGKGRLHITDEGIVLLARTPTPALYSLRPAGRRLAFWVTSQFVLMCR